MDKCCTLRLEPRQQRRLNGLQLPLNYQQVLGWIILVTTALLNFIVLTEMQFYELKMVSLVIYIILYICHVGSHAMALLTDPSERELRKLKVNNVPEFDRSIHTHVIENGRCHLCNIYTSSRRTKHCGLCNKCVDRFDHHCKWLNNCVGHRNYRAFITSVITGLLISLYTSSLCLSDIVLFLTHPEQLSPVAQNFINCTLFDAPQFTKYCRNSMLFVTFLLIFFVIALAVACALLHLCCFHVYIAILGMSTYEYIVRSDRFKTSSLCNTVLECSLNKFSNRWYRVNDNLPVRISPPEIGEQGETANSVVSHTKPDNLKCNNEGAEANKFISSLFANDRAKNIFLYKNKNKILPRDNTAS